MVKIDIEVPYHLLVNINISNSWEHKWVINTGIQLNYNLKKENLPKACNFIKKESLAQVFSCEFCRISKNTFFNRTPPDDCFCFSQLLKWQVFLPRLKLFSRIPEIFCICGNVSNVNEWMNVLSLFWLVESEEIYERIVVRQNLFLYLFSLSWMLCEWVVHI